MVDTGDICALPTHPEWHQVNMKNLWDQDQQEHLLSAEICAVVSLLLIRAGKALGPVLEECSTSV